ncbi:hypothetical protein D9M68_430250 [compost metagenome]
MQHMPDKDFDNLFRDKFMDAEIEPSANLWDKIETHLEPKRKRVFPLYWMAAASVAVVFTAMLLFQKKEKIQLQGQPAIVAEQPVTLPETSLSAEAAVESSVSIDRPLLGGTGTTAKLVSHVKNVGTENISTNTALSLQPDEDFVRLPIKQADPKPIDVLPAKADPVENPIVIAQAEPQQKVENNVISEIEHTEKKGIRNVGDLVNYVVDKVDKREKKLVRFNTDDDDNSSIVGINIGFLKFNKKDR